MQNAGLTIGMVAIGLGLASIGFNLNGNQANATTAAPVAFNAGPEEPTIVWYDVVDIHGPYVSGFATNSHALYRAWSDGTLELRVIASDGKNTFRPGCWSTSDHICTSDWIVIFSPNEGLNAAADINLDSIVDGADLAAVLNAWGDAPRNPMPPSDCPLGLIP